MEKEITYIPKPEDFVIEGCDDASAEQISTTSLTYWQLSFKKFRENKVALTAAILLLLIVFAYFRKKMPPSVWKTIHISFSVMLTIGIIAHITHAVFI